MHPGLPADGMGQDEKSIENGQKKVRFLRKRLAFLLQI